MATTSGKYNTVTVTRDDIILDALQDLQVLMDGRGPTPGDKQDAARKLNFLIKRMQIGGKFLWCLDIITVPTQAGKAKYFIGPGGDDLTGLYRPLRVLPGTVIRTGSQPAISDTELQILSRYEYQSQSAKLAPGVPNALYYDPQMGGAGSYNPQSAVGILYLWPTPADSTRSVFLQVQRPIQDITDGNSAFDLPVEWYHALTKNLARDLMGKYEVPRDRRAEIRQDAIDALKEIADWAVVDSAAAITFAPDTQMGQRHG